MVIFFIILDKLDKRCISGNQILDRHCGANIIFFLINFA